ncbi:MAG: tRNA 2-thiouridine(34) synthase MnmA [Candidatus Omnitrophica bacterium]|nr:tRNA 2-thiouridine(34) synthase MnmA [Candidatus Omnitrophota bacterium]
MKKVMVAMSGGVDSSVAALLLKKAGFNVVGLTMCLGIKSDDGGKRCCGPESISDAKKVCRDLDIKHYVMDFSTELEDKIISKFLGQYLKGQTPNPCVDCNKFIKFGSLLEKTRALGFDYLATGHYAKIGKKEGEFLLKKPEDKVKDQTYFLYPIKKGDLSSILFPLADYTKQKVRKIAKDNHLVVFDKPQSQDLCFVMEKKYTKFIRQKNKSLFGGEKPKEGLIVNTAGRILGKHTGISNYTIGQRKGLGVSAPEPLYVLSINPEENEIIVGEKDKLKQKGLIAGDLNFFTDCLPEKLKAQIRYRHQAADCKIEKIDKKLKVIFDDKQEAITPGQAAVFYDNDTVLGGGTIESALDENNHKIPN